MRNYCLAVLLALSAPLAARSDITVLDDVTRAHILPGYANLSENAQVLKETAQQDCSITSPELRLAFADAFDSWIAVSHLRFGPSEIDDRAFSLAFWPDTKGFTAKALSQLISAEDPVVKAPSEFAETSVAGRGFFALEYLIYDPAFADAGSAQYRCALVRAIAADIDRNAGAIDADWDGYAQTLATPGPESRYRNENEAMQELFKAFSTGLEFTADTRLGRPLGTFDRPRPNRAEARRSQRSLRHIELSLIALRGLGSGLAMGHPEIAADLEAAFDRALSRARSLDDPALASVADPQGRIRVEALQQSITDIRAIASLQLGPALGISTGFNALDGD